MIRNLMWGVTAVSLYSTILNLKRKRVCFLIWMFTDLAWSIYDISIANYPQGVLMAIYFMLAIWGYLEWKPKN